MISRAKSASRGEGERGSLGDENHRAPDTTTAFSGVYFPSVSSEPSADGDLSVKGSESSSLDESVAVPTAELTAARKLASNLVGPGNGEKLGPTKALARVPNKKYLSS